MNGLITPAMYCTMHGHWWGKDDRCETCKADRHPWIVIHPPAPSGASAGRQA